MSAVTSLCPWLHIPSALSPSFPLSISGSRFPSLSSLPALASPCLPPSSPCSSSPFSSSLYPPSHSCLLPSFPSFLSFSFPPDPASFTYPCTWHWQNAESSVWRSGRAFKGETIRGDGGIQDQRLPQDTRGMYSRTPPSSSWKSGGGEGEFHGQTPFPERVLPLSSSAFLPLCM